MKRLWLLLLYLPLVLLDIRLKAARRKLKQLESQLKG